MAFPLFLLQENLAFSHIEFALGDGPILTSGSEKIQLSWLHGKVDEFISVQGDSLSSKLQEKLRNLNAKAARAFDIPIEANEMEHIAREILLSLLEAGAPFVAFIVNSHFENNTARASGMRISEHSESMLLAYRQNSAKQWEVEADFLLNSWNDSLHDLKLQIDIATDLDEQINLEQELLEGINLPIDNPIQVENYLQKVSLSIVNPENSRKKFLFVELVQGFLESDYVDDLTPEQIQTLKSGIRYLTNDDQRLGEKVINELTLAAEEAYAIDPEFPILDLRQQIVDMINDDFPKLSESASQLAERIEQLVKNTIPESQVDTTGLLVELDED